MPDRSRLTSHVALARSGSAPPAHRPAARPKGLDRAPDPSLAPAPAARASSAPLAETTRAATRAKQLTPWLTAVTFLSTPHASRLTPHASRLTPHRKMRYAITTQKRPAPITRA